MKPYIKPSQVKVKSVGRLAKPYEGADVITEWHKERTKSSVAEAFKGADYAIAVEGSPSEWKDMVEFVGGMAILAPFIFVAFYIAFIILKALGIVVVL
jgi:hypothetical protein